MEEGILILTHQIGKGIYINDTPLVLTSVGSDFILAAYKGVSIKVNFNREHLLDKSLGVKVSFKYIGKHSALVTFYAPKSVNLLREKLYIARKRKRAAQSW